MDRDLELNSIDRYVKASPRFVLEEHSHCEVPAGCGGVVLRWSNPALAVPVRLEVWTSEGAGRRTVRIDGVMPSTSRPQIPPGRRVFMIEAQPPEDEQILVLVRAISVV